MFVKHFTTFFIGRACVFLASRAVACACRPSPEKNAACRMGLLWGRIRKTPALRVRNAGVSRCHDKELKIIMRAILNKYENRLPKSYEQKVNKFIKEVTREAGITEKIEVSYVENGEKKMRLVNKCDLVKTHTARRSGATNMYLAGIPTIAIMKITGHKTEKEFMKYIKITEEQTAMELMSHPYFSRASNTTQ